MSRIILLNKPFQVLSQFSDTQGRATLKAYLSEYSRFYPAGRLDYDSEGLILLTDNGQLQHQISDPKHKLNKTYWAQVEGQPSEQDLDRLRAGIELKDGPCRPAKVSAIAAPPMLWPRTPPIRERQNIPTQWLEITISEGRNRQVRRMTAAIEHPTLRLIRAAIGPWRLDQLQSGEHRLETVNTPTTPPRRNTGSRAKNNSQKNAVRGRQSSKKTR